MAGHPLGRYPGDACRDSELGIFRFRSYKELNQMPHTKIATFQLSAQLGETYGYIRAGVPCA